MRTFVINLVKESQKKALFLESWKDLLNDVEILEAVDGRALSLEELKHQVKDYPAPGLTPGEIGCALSHLNVYRKIVAKKISYALVLEDDARPTNLYSREILQSIETKIKANGFGQRFVIFLQESEHIDISHEPRLFEIESCPFVSVQKMWSSHAYIISYEAAEALCRFLPPIRYEADYWEGLCLGAHLQMAASLLPLIVTNDPDKANSSLEQNRTKIRDLRNTMRTKQAFDELGIRNPHLRIKLFPLNRFIKKHYQLIRQKQLLKAMK